MFHMFLKIIIEFLLRLPKNLVTDTAVNRLFEVDPITRTGQGLY